MTFNSESSSATLNHRFHNYPYLRWQKKGIKKSRARYGNCKKR